MDAAATILRRPLAQRLDLGTLGTRATLIVERGSSRGSFHPHLVDEDQVRAMAAMLRAPMIGQNDEVYLGKVLNALRRCVEPEVALEVVEPLQRWFKLFPGAHYFSAQGWPADSGPQQVVLLKDRQIAVEWLYGEHLHFDRARRERLRFLDEASKQQAALLWVKDACVLVHLVRRNIADLEERGAIHDPS